MARTGAALAYDEGRGRIVMFGGTPVDDPLGGAQQSLDDTWEWDGSRWLPRQPHTVPPPRDGAAMAYDPVRRRVVLFGGTDDNTELDDLWAYDEEGWHEIPAGGPSPRAGHTFAFDPLHGLALLFGGTRGGTAVGDEAWVFDALSDTWTPLDDNDPAPDGREFSAMAFDREASEFVMFSGGDSGQYQDTWTLSFEQTACLGEGGAAGSAGAPGD